MSVSPVVMALMSTAGNMATSGKVNPDDPFKIAGSNVGKFMPFQLSNPYASFGGNSFLGRNKLSSELLGEETQTPQYFNPSNPFFNVGIKTKGTDVAQPADTGSKGGGK